MKIKSLSALRVWDSRGRPTIEVCITTQSGITGRAIAPAGASTGSGEAVDRRDGGSFLGGYDVLDAVHAVRTEIADALIGHDVRDQEAIDRALEQCDGTPNFARLGEMRPSQLLWRRRMRRRHISRFGGICWMKHRPM